MGFDFNLENAKRRSVDVDCCGRLKTMLSIDGNSLEASLYPLEQGYGVLLLSTQRCQTNTLILNIERP